MSNYSYALVSGRIEAYLTDSLVHTLSPCDNETQLIEFETPSGIHCVAWAGDFIQGTLEELTDILKNKAHETDSIYRSVKRALPKLSDLEDQILKFLVQDGYGPDEIDYKMVSDITQQVCFARNWCASIEDAYMDIMY